MYTSYGWMDLVLLDDAKNIRVITDDGSFLVYMRKQFGEKIYTKDFKKDSYLVINLHKKSKLGRINAKKYEKVFLLTYNSSSIGLAKKIFMIMLKKLQQVSPEGSAKKRRKLKYFKKQMPLEKLVQTKRLLFFVDEVLCTHIIDMDDKVGINLFIGELTKVKLLRFLRLMPLGLKKLLIIILSEQQLLVFEKS